MMKQYNPRHAVIFDMDGVIINSEPIKLRVLNRILGCGSVKITDVEFKQYYVGKRTDENIKRILRKNTNISKPLHKLLLEFENVYLGITKQGLQTGKYKENKGLKPLLRKLKRKNIPLAVASGSTREEIDLILRGLQIIEYFETITSAEEVKRGKPNPEIFLITAKKLGVEPQRCVIIEDSQAGVKAAKRARMKCIAVPNKFTNHHDLSDADLRCESLAEISPRVLDSLFG